MESQERWHTVGGGGAGRRKALRGTVALAGGLSTGQSCVTLCQSPLWPRPPPTQMEGCTSLSLSAPEAVSLCA